MRLLPHILVEATFEYQSKFQTEFGHPSRLKSEVKNKQGIAVDKEQL